jgi:diaminopimelate epimerase
MTTYRLAKHHGLGNDFLVLLGTGAELAGVGPDLAVRWCQRHTGVGADGLLLGVTDPEPDADGPIDLVMTLFNADGSRAEMSGNGIRCLAHAEVVRRGVARADLRIATDGGLRTVAVEAGPDAATVVAAVDMGPAGTGPTADREPDPAAADDAVAFAREPLRALTVDLGNPHLVLLVDDPAKVDVALMGPYWEAGYDAGINVHAIAPTPGADDDLTMAIWERGAGATMACGTGATAAAHAAHAWGLVGDHVRVRMPGGDVEVVVGDPMTLRGPSVRIAALELDA